MDYLPDEKVKCHETGFQESCREMVVNCSCRKWVQIIGNNPNTGEPMNKWDCTDAWMPLLMIENSMMQRQTGAAVDMLRNEAVQASEKTCKVIAAAASIQQRVVPQLEARPLRDRPGDG